MLFGLFGKKKKKTEVIENINTEFVTYEMIKDSHCINMKKEIDKDKTYVLLLDDDYAQVYALEKQLKKKGIENILRIYGKDAVLRLLCMLKEDGLKVDRAIIDLTFGQVIEVDGIKYKANGIDAVKALIDKNSKCKIVLYTGNTLNKYLSYTKELEAKFRKIADKDMREYVVVKGSLPIDRKADILLDKMKEIK
jgi:hypothetical protein